MSGHRPGDPSAAGKSAPRPRAQVIDSRALFADTRELLIRHGNDLYRLRVTQSGKLILTK